MKIIKLTVYPVKSFKGIDLDQATLTRQGLAWDRHWMLVNEQQSFVTQREIPALASISVALTEHSLVLSHPKAGSIEISLEKPQSQLRLVTLWGDTCKALPESEDVTRWLVSAVGVQAKGVRLVRFATEFERPARAIDGATAPTYFADGYPLTIGTTGSLDALNEALRDNQQMPVPMERFRPNILIDCPTPWAEDSWKTISTANDTIHLSPCKPCQRCKIVTTDQQTGQIPEPKEPLATLVKLNTQPALKGAHFCQNATINKGHGATMSVGDEVQVIDERKRSR